MRRLKQSSFVGLEKRVESKAQETVIGEEGPNKVVAGLRESPITSDQLCNLMLKRLARREDQD